MAPEVRFTSFGIPYLVEFANVTFRRKKRASFRRSATTNMYSIPHLNDSDWTFASASTDTLVFPVVEKNEAEGQGLHIRFASHATYPHRPLSPSRLYRMKRRIANAVVSVGMDPAPVPDKGDARDIDSKPLPAIPNESSFYRGTYGQVMEALEAADLCLSPCDEDGFDGATFLGVLFVGSHSINGSVELMKLTLWA